MEAGAGAVVGPTSIGVAFEGPYATIVKWAAFAIGWTVIFNTSVVFATYGFMGAWDHWFELFFFWIAVPYRHAKSGVAAVAGSVLPQKCNGLQRAILGGSYCDRVEDTARRVEALKKANPDFKLDC